AQRRRRSGTNFQPAVLVCGGGAGVARVHRGARPVDDVVDGAPGRVLEPLGHDVLEGDARRGWALDGVVEHHRVVEVAVDAEAAPVEVGDAARHLDGRVSVLAVVRPGRLRGDVVRDLRL